MVYADQVPILSEPALKMLQRKESIKAIVISLVFASVVTFAASSVVLLATGRTTIIAINAATQHHNFNYLIGSMASAISAQAAISRIYEK